MKFYASLKNAIKLYGYCKERRFQLLIDQEEKNNIKSAIQDFETKVLCGFMDYKDWYRKYQFVVHIVNKE
jgi:hypothetical protein